MAENWLKDYGFNALELPRRNLAPCDVLLRQRGLFDQKAGTLQMLLTSRVLLPDPSQGEPVANIGRTVGKKVKAGLGLKILGALFGGASASKLGAETSLRHARSLAVTYEDVVQVSLPVLELQTWIEGATVQTSRQAMVWLNGEQLAVVTAVLRTAKLSIIAERDDGASLELSVPEIQGIVSGGATVSVDSSSRSRVTFRGTEPIAFGFQGFVMKFEGNVSFGLDPVRTKGIGADPAEHAWVAEEAIERIGDMD